MFRQPLPVSLMVSLGLLGDGHDAHTTVLEGGMLWY